MRYYKDKLFVVKIFVMGIIYILENKVNGKKYVGKTKLAFGKRLKRHRKSHSLIGNALRKYGTDNFKVTLVEIPNENLSEKEIESIKEYNSKYPYGYNLTDGGDSPPLCFGNKWNLGKTLTDEHKRSISEGLKGKRKGLRGKPHTQETRKKISDGNKGKLLTEETKKKISEARKGCKFTEEHKANISMALKGMKPSPNCHKKGTHKSDEWKKKMSIVMKGHKHSEETKRKISEASKGRHLSEETRAKMSEAHKRRVTNVL